MRLRVTIATFLDGDRGQNQLKVVLDAMLHFPKQDLTPLRFGDRGHEARLLVGLRIVAQRGAYQRRRSVQKFGRVLGKVSRSGTVHLQHAPCSAVYQYRHVAYRDDVMLDQKFGANKILMLGEILDADWLRCLKSPARRRPKLNRERRAPHDTFFPSHARDKKKVGRFRTISKNLDVVDLDGSRDLDNGLVQKAIQIGVFNRKTTDIDQNANVPPQFIQHLAFNRFG